MKKNKNTKIALALSTLIFAIGASLPILTISSCSQQNNNEDVLSVGSKQTIETIYKEDIVNNLKTLDTSLKLFDNLDSINFKNVTVTLKNKENISGNQTNQLILSTKSGYIFVDGVKKIESKEFTIVEILSGISKKEIVPKPINKLELNKILNNETVLNKFFNGLNDNAINNIDVTLIQLSEQKYQIKLTTKSNYYFNKDKLDNIISNKFELNSILKKETVDILFSDYWKNKKIFYALDLEGIAEIESEAFLNRKITSIIFPDNIKKIGINAFKSNKLSKIIIPNSVDSIGLGAFIENEFIDATSITISDVISSKINWLEVFGVKHLDDKPNPPTETILNITPKSINNINFNNTIFSEVINDQKNINKFFDGINADNIKQIESTKFSFLENGIKLILTAKSGSVFNENKTVLSSELFNIKKYTIEEIENSVVKGPSLNDSNIIDYLRLHHVYNISNKLILLPTTDLNVSFIEELPTLIDKEKVLYFSRKANTDVSAQFEARIIPKSYGNDWSKIKTIEPIKNENGGNLQITINGFKSKSVLSNEFQFNQITEMNSILDEIKINGLQLTDLGKNSNINIKNSSNYNLNKFIDFKNKKSLIYTGVEIHYAFTNIKINELTGEVKFSLHAFGRNTADGQMNRYEDWTLFRSKTIDDLSIKFNTKIGYATTYQAQEEKYKAKINRTKLNTIIDTTTKNKKSQYIPHKISRDQLLSTIENYEIKPNNVFFDYIADGDKGILTVRLIERVVDEGSVLVPLEGYTNTRRETFNRILNSRNNPSARDNILDEVIINGFKKFDDFSVEEKAGFTTFKTWYAWKRSFSVGIGRINENSRYLKDSNGKYIKNNNGNYMRRDTIGTGSGFIAHKFSDTEFTVATNVHVLEELKQANNTSGSWVQQGTSQYGKVSWKAHDFDFDYKENLTFRQVNPRDIPTEEVQGKPFLDEFKRDGVKVNLETKKIEEYVYDLLGSDGISWSYPDSKKTIINDLEKVESIKIDNLFSKKYINDDPRTQVLDPLSSTTELNKDYQKNSNNFNVALDLGFIRIKFKTDDNSINKIWEEIGPTSFAPVDDMVLTNFGSYEEFVKQDKLKSWNNITTGGYPSKDDDENKDSVNYRFTFKGDGAKDQNGDNDYLKSIIAFNDAWDYGLNTPIISVSQKQNENTHGGASGSPIYDKNMNIIAILAHAHQGAQLGENSSNVNSASAYPFIADVNVAYYANELAYSYSYQTNVRLLAGFTNYDVTKKLK